MRTKFNTSLKVVRSEEKEKLSIAHCRKVLGKEGENLTDDEILEVRDVFYQLAEITLEQYQHEKSQVATIIYLEQDKYTQHEKESNYLRAS
jgi:hypothetical protein